MVEGAGISVTDGSGVVLGSSESSSKDTLIDAFGISILGLPSVPMMIWTSALLGYSSLVFGFVESVGLPKPMLFRFIVEDSTTSF